MAAQLTATGYLVDSELASPLAAVSAWMQNLASGEFMVSVATVAVASLGIALLLGRLEIRRGIRVVLGCFILFGASVIAAGLSGLVIRPTASKLAEQPRDFAPSNLGAPKVAPSAGYDPYAGAAITPRR